MISPLDAPELRALLEALDLVAGRFVTVEAEGWVVVEELGEP